MIVASRHIKRVISYRRKFYKYTGRSVSRTGSESQTTHEITGIISRLNGVRAVCEETELSYDATALTEDHADDSKLVHFATQISESMPTQTPHNVEADTRTSRTSDRQSKQWTNHLRISLWERACKTEKEKAGESASAKEYKVAKTLAVVVGG